MGRVFAGTVRNVAPFGAFVDVGVGVDGLLHSSQFGSSDRIEIGARVDVAVVEVDEPRTVSYTHLTLPTILLV